MSKQSADAVHVSYCEVQATAAAWSPSEDESTNPAASRVKTKLAGGAPNFLRGADDLVVGVPGLEEMGSFFRIAVTRRKAVLITVARLAGLIPVTRNVN
jgi:hypothetical protein